MTETRWSGIPYLARICQSISRLTVSKALMPISTTAGQQRVRVLPRFWEILEGNIKRSYGIATTLSASEFGLVFNPISSWCPSSLIAIMIIIDPRSLLSEGHNKGLLSGDQSKTTYVAVAWMKFSVDAVLIRNLYVRSVKPAWICTYIQYEYINISW